MNKSISIYLDFARFFAAILVFFSHLLSQEFNTVFEYNVWMGHQSVVIFFVLSGYVISYVTDTKEKTISQYFAARLGRLYSVVLPALLLTVVLDYVGRLIDPNIYLNVANNYPLLRILISSLFLNQIWNLHVMPLSNGPFWSLGYEFWYYIIFGSFCFFGGKLRYYLPLLFCIIAGPHILMMFPLWLIGVFTYWAQKHWSPTQFTARCICLFCLITIFLIFKIGNPLQFIAVYFSTNYLNKELYFCQSIGCHYIGLSFAIVPDFLLGILFGLSILTFKHTNYPKTVLNKAEPTIRYFAGSTFSLYLFHLPLIYFITSIIGKNTSSYFHVLLTGILVFIFSILLSYIGERRVTAYRNFFNKIFIYIENYKK